MQTSNDFHVWLWAKPGQNHGLPMAVSEMNFSYIQEPFLD